MRKAAVRPGNDVRIIVEQASQISELEVTEKDIKRMGRAASISDRGIVDLMDNRLRKEVLGSFHHIFARSIRNGSNYMACGLMGRMQGAGGGHAGEKSQAPEYIDAAYSVGRWSVSRFRRMVAELREPALGYVPDGTFLDDLEGLQCCVMAEAFAIGGGGGGGGGASDGGGNGGGNDDGGPDNDCGDRDDDLAVSNLAADSEMWMRYAVNVRGMKGDVLGISKDELAKLRIDAVDYFRDQVVEALTFMEGEAFMKCLYLLAKYQVGSLIFELIFPQLRKKIPEEILKEEFLPSFAVLIVIQQRAPHAATLLESVVNVLFTDPDLVTESMVCSALEYCAHTQKSECARVLLDLAGEKITSEGLVCALLPVCMRGEDHYLAMLELFVMDKATQVELAKDPELAALLSGAEVPKSSSMSQESAEDFTTFIAKSIYVLLFLSAVGGYAKAQTVIELIEFQEATLAPFSVNIITKEQHARFLAHTFFYVCSLNYSSVAWALIEKGLAPTSLIGVLQDATMLGHQNIVHLLLESLLLTDEKLQPSGLPIIFRKQETLNVLPLIARRFPREAAWFLEQLSCVPLPACVPRSRNSEPDVRARPVKGLLLGSLSMQDTIRHRKEQGSTVHVWPHLNMNGQLRQAGSGKDDFETESVVCISPEAILTGVAFHQSLGHISNRSSPFIRLLAEDNEQIILQPIMRALMEFHWSAGRFWLRFALQFFTTLIYVICLAILFIMIVQQQNAKTVDDNISNTILYPLGCVVLLFALFFIFQEARELLDYPARYFRSGSNVVDFGIHATAIYTTVCGTFASLYVHPLLMALTLVLCAFRMIIHLRALPSVGPLIRLWVTASVNILPILIPMGVMAISFSGAFYVLEFEAAADSGVPSLHFSAWHTSIQSVLTMATADYSVLDNSQHPQIFALRFIFHICFIIFLVNIIIALMTVNVADIHANTTAAWLLEIAGLMVELELFWPWPQRYNLPLNGSKDKESDPDVKARRSARRKTAKSIAERNENDDIGSIVPGSSEFATFLAENSTILYTWPQEIVSKAPWWGRLANRGVEEYANVGKDKSSRDGGPPSVSDLTKKPTVWNNLMDRFGLGARGQDSTNEKSVNRLTTIFPEPIQERDNAPNTSVSMIHFDARASMASASAFAKASKAGKSRASKTLEESQQAIILEKREATNEVQTTNSEHASVQLEQPERPGQGSDNDSDQLQQQKQHQFHPVRTSQSAVQAPTRLSVLQPATLSTLSPSVAVTGYEKDEDGIPVQSSNDSIGFNFDRRPSRNVEVFTARPNQSLTAMGLGTKRVLETVEVEPIDDPIRRPSMWKDGKPPMLVSSAVPESSVIERRMSIKGKMVNSFTPQPEQLQVLDSAASSGPAIQAAPEALVSMVTTMTSQMELLKDSMRGIEKFMRAEAKNNRDRLAKMEQDVEETRQSHETLQKLAAELGKMMRDFGALQKGTLTEEAGNKLDSAGGSRRASSKRILPM